MGRKPTVPLTLPRRPIRANLGGSHCTYTHITELGSPRWGAARVLLQLPRTPIPNLLPSVSKLEPRARAQGWVWEALGQGSEP